MKFNKLDLRLYIKSGNLNWILYLIASLVILIPIAIVFITGNPFSSSFSKISIDIAFVFVILGKFFALLKKEKGDKSIPIDIGIIIGILIAFIIKLGKTIQ